MNFNCTMREICNNFQVVVINLGVIKYHLAHSAHKFKQMDIAYKHRQIYNGKHYGDLQTLGKSQRKHLEQVQQC